MKKAIKIDVVKQSIYEVEIKDSKDIYKHIGNDCNTFCCPVEFENQDCIYADDEGLLKEVQGCFVMGGWSSPIVGNAIILGTDDEGDSIDHKSTIDEIKNNLIFGNELVAKSYQKALDSRPMKMETYKIK